MSALTINLDLLAAVREIRHLAEPDPAQAAVLAELGGADGVSIQIRRDRRFVRDRDLYLLKGIVKTKLTFEMPPADDIVQRVMDVKPDVVTLVADHADTSTPVSPIDFGNSQIDFSDVSGRLNGIGLTVCYFVEPEADQIKGALKAGATAVLINCTGYTRSRSMEEAQTELDRIDRAGRYAAKAGLTVVFGRGITPGNIRPLLELGYVDEFVVGHAVCSRAMMVGFERAVRDMVELIRTGPTSASVT